MPLMAFGFLALVCAVFIVAELGLREMDKRTAAKRELERIAARQLGEGQRGRP